MTVNNRKRKIKEAKELLQDRFNFRLHHCWMCYKMRMCLPVKVMIKGEECQRMVCCECLRDVAQEAIEKQKKVIKKLT